MGSGFPSDHSGTGISWPSPEEANFLLSVSPNDIFALDKFYQDQPDSMQVSEVKSNAMPPPPGVTSIDKIHLQAIYKFLVDMNYTDEVDLSTPVLRTVFRPGYTLVSILMMYFVLTLLGVVGNLVMVSSILRKKLHRDNTLACMLNVSMAFWVQLIVVIPLSLFVLLVHNWVLGKFVCYILPMAQDIPHYCLMLTILLLSVDRYKKFCRGEVTRLPIAWALVMVWGVSVTLVFPYAAYITYIDLSILGDTLLGGQMCFVSLTGSASQYIKALFILVYLVPSGVSLMLLILTWNELRHQEKSLQTMGIREEHRGSRDPLHRARPSLAAGPPNEDEGGADAPAHARGGGGGGADAPGPDMNTKRRLSRAMSITRNAGNEMVMSSGSIQPLTASHSTVVLGNGTLSLDIRKETRAQKYLLLIVLVYVACLLPLNILRIVRQIVDERYENDGHFDYSYIIIVWIAFLPTVVVPWLFAHWVLIGTLSTQQLGRLIPHNSMRRRSTQEIAQQRRVEEAARFPDPNCHPRRASRLDNALTGAPSPNGRKCSGYDPACAKSKESRPSGKSANGDRVHWVAEHYHYNGSHPSGEPSVSQMTFEAISLDPQPLAQLSATSHRASHHDQMIRKTLQDQRTSLGGLSPAKKGKASRKHESVASGGSLRLESIQCFNQNQARRKSIASKEDLTLRPTQYLGSDSLGSNGPAQEENRRRSYCPGYHTHVGGAVHEKRTRSNSRDDIRRHSCQPQAEIAHHRDPTNLENVIEVATKGPKLQRTVV